MKNIRYFLVIICTLTVFVTLAQVPAGYYAAAENKSGSELRTALFNIIKNHTSVSYNQLWESFKTTDKRPDNGKVWDMYSDRPGGTPAYYYTFGSDQCGSYSGEGDCYNREHSVPKSWFGGTVAPMNTDIFHLIPADGYVNGRRSNLPVGEVINPAWTSTNGSQIGTSNISGYSGNVFEPIDSFKGDFARTYFYMAVCYMDKNLGVETQSNFSGGDLKAWSKQLLLQWAALDPVSQKEINRNNAIYQIQHNRNPFIDYPELAEKVFGSDNSPFSTSISAYTDRNRWLVYPNPTSANIHIQSFDYKSDITTIEISDIAGKTLFTQQAEPADDITVNISQLPAGMYLMKIHTDQNIHTFKIVKK